jgi:predicted signal transduction protein with EAL and GGDEF domain
VLLRNAEQWDEVAATADRLLKEVEAPLSLNGRDVTVSSSIGIALYPDDAADHEELVQHADTAMYAAKNLGRARYSFFRAEFNAQILATLQLEQELMRALECNEFVLHYQPQVASASGVLLGCEALIRWNHPERGMVPPAQFIGVAEQCGLIADVGAWTLRAACAQIAQWKAARIAFGSVAVNVSALEFRNHRLVDTLTQAMTEFDVAPDELEIEITESVLMTDTDTTHRIVERLHALGVRLAVDDFGTGYSSLAYLKHLRPSKVKIDRSFVRDLSDDESDRVLVKAIVQLAHTLDISVVAEGVETTEQRDYLRQIGCNVLQGYLISRPQPAERFERFVLDFGDAESEVIDATTWTA